MINLVVVSIKTRYNILGSVERMLIGFLIRPLFTKVKESADKKENTK